MKKTAIIIIIFTISLLYSVDRTFSIDEATLIDLRNAVNTEDEEPLIKSLWEADRNPMPAEEEEFPDYRPLYNDFFHLKEKSEEGFRKLLEQTGNLTDVIDFIVNFDEDMFFKTIYDTAFTSPDDYAQYENDGNNSLNYLNDYSRGRELAYALLYYPFMIDITYYEMTPGQRDTVNYKAKKIADFAYDLITDDNIWADSKGWCEKAAGTHGLVPLIGFQSSNRLLMLSGMGYCYLVADDPVSLETKVKEEFVSSDNYPEGSNYHGLNDYFVTETGRAACGLTYQQRPMYLAPLFFNALKRREGINLYNRQNEWNCDFICRMTEQTLLRIDSQFHHVLQEDDLREENDDKRIEYGLIDFMYQSDETEIAQDIKWYITCLKNKNGGTYPKQCPEAELTKNMTAISSYNREASFSENFVPPEFLQNGSYSNEELTILRPAMLSNQTDNAGNLTIPQLFVSHEKSYVYYHSNDDKTAYQLFFGGEYFIIETGYREWFDTWWRGTDWHISNYSQNVIIINPDSMEVYTNDSGTEFVGEYADLQEINLPDIEGNITNLNYKGPQSRQKPETSNTIYDPCIRNYFTQNFNLSRLQVEVTDQNPDGLCYSPVTNPCLITRNFYMIDDSYYIIYDTIEDTNNHSNIYRNQIHLNDNDAENVSITINPGNELGGNVFTERINNKYLHGVMGASSDFKSHFDNQNLPLGWDQSIGARHSRIRITAENENPANEFLTVLIPGCDNSHPVTDQASTDSSYIVKYDIDPNDGLHSFAGIKRGGEFTDTFRNSPCSFQTDSNFLLIKADSDYSDIRKFIVKNTDHLAINGLNFPATFEIFKASEKEEEISAVWDENSLHVSTLIKIEGNPAPFPPASPVYKIRRNGVLPENFISETDYFIKSNSGQEPNERGKIENNIATLAYDNDFFYVNYNWARLEAENLISDNLTLYTGTWYEKTLNNNLGLDGNVVLKGENWKINPNGKLTLHAGANISFADNFQLINEGELIGNGAKNNPVNVTGCGNSNNYRIKSKSGSKTNLSWCNFSDMGLGYCMKGNIELNNCNFSSHQNFVISAPESYSILNSNFRSSQTGLLLMNSKITTEHSWFDHCNFTENSGGFYCYNASPIMQNCLFSGNQNFGLKAVNTSNPVLNNSIFHDNRNLSMDKPEIIISSHSYPALERRQNDIIFDDGYSVYAKNNSYGTFSVKDVYWGTVNQSEIEASFATQNNAFDWNVIFTPYAQNPYQYDSGNGGTFNPTTSFDLGLEAEISGDYETAEINYKNATEEDPYSPDALRASQRLLNIAGNFDQSLIDYYTDIIAEHEDSELALNSNLNIWQLCRKTGYYQEAVSGYEYMAENSENSVDSLYRELDIVYTWLEAEEDNGRSANLVFKNSERNLSSRMQAEKRESELLALLNKGLKEDGIYSPQTNELKIENYPNPFNPVTTVRFGLPEDDHVNLAIYNVKGQKVKTLLDDDFKKGFHSIEWKGIDYNGKKAGSGVYFYVIKTDKYPALIKKCLILK